MMPLAQREQNAGSYSSKGNKKKNLVRIFAWVIVLLFCVIVPIVAYYLRPNTPTSYQESSDIIDTPQIVSMETGENHCDKSENNNLKEVKKEAEGGDQREEAKKDLNKLLEEARYGIQFNQRDITLKAVSYPLLDQIAIELINRPTYIVEISCHTDNVGEVKELSCQRAKSIMKYLISQGVPENRLSAVGYGSDMPIASNKEKYGRAKNRRVEFVIVSK